MQHPISRARLISGAFLLTTVVACQADPAESPAAQAVEAAYHALGAYSSGDGATQARFALSDFRDIPARELAATPVRDVVTLPGGRTMQVHRNSRADGTAEYAMRWSDSTPTWEDSDQGKANRDLTVDAAIDLGRKAGVIDGEVEGVVAFAVTATMGDSARSYRAFAWRLRAATGSERVLVMDDIVPGAESAAHEARPPWTNPAAAASTPGFSIVYFGKSCVASTTHPSGHAGGWDDSQGHLTGHHAGTAWADATCTCSTSCESTCDASATAGIEENGFIEYANIHVAKTETAGGHGYQAEGDVTGASCNAGAVFGVRECVFPVFCDLSLSVGVGEGGSISISTGNASYAHPEQWAFNCPRCTVMPPKKKVVKSCSCGATCSVTASCEDTDDNDPNGYGDCGEAFNHEDDVPDPEGCGGSVCGDGQCDAGEDCAADCAPSCDCAYGCDAWGNCNPPPCDCPYGCDAWGSCNPPPCDSTCWSCGTYNECGDYCGDCGDGGDGDGGDGGGGGGWGGGGGGGSEDCWDGSTCEDGFCWDGSECGDGKEMRLRSSSLASPVRAGSMAGSTPTGSSSLASPVRAGSTRTGSPAARPGSKAAAHAAP